MDAALQLCSSLVEGSDEFLPLSEGPGPIFDANRKFSVPSLLIPSSEQQASLRLKTNNEPYLFSRSPKHVGFGWLNSHQFINSES